MKIVRFQHRGSTEIGLLEGRGLIRLSELAPEIQDIDQLLDGEVSGRVRSLAETAKVFLDLADVQILPPLSAQARMFGVGRNFHSLMEETKRDLPQWPAVFLRARESLVGHGGVMLRPLISSQLTYEGELAIVIGRSGKHISKQDAHQFIAGYTCCNDGTVIDYVRRSPAVGKNFDATGAIGPYIVTADEIPDVQSQTLRTVLNGVEVQNTRLDTMIFSLSEIVSYISAFTTLHPGDIITTGTPAGVGSTRTPPLWLKDGDIVDVEISKVGVLRTHVVEEPASQAV